MGRNRGKNVLQLLELSNVVIKRYDAMIFGKFYHSLGLLIKLDIHIFIFL